MATDVVTVLPVGRSPSMSVSPIGEAGKVFRRSSFVNFTR
jgi:hypothetical protein